MVLDLLTGWGLFSGLILSIGAVALRWGVLTRTPHHEPDAGRLLAGAGAAGAALVLCGLGLGLLRQFLEFRDPFAPAGEDLALLLSTPWGSIWKTSAAAGILAVVTFLLARVRPWAWGGATLLALGLGFYPGLTGHAAGAGGARTLALGADALHVWGAGAWIGGLALLLLLDRCLARDPGDSGSWLAGTVHLFSPLALGGAGVLAVSGAYATWREVGGVAELLQTEYGRILLLKLGLVLLVVALGAANWKRFTPRLGTAEGDRMLRKSARLELLLANAVLLATAILVRTSPGGP